MDSFHAIRDRARRKISAWWHMLPRWERFFHVLTTLLFVPTVLLTALVYYVVPWDGYGLVWLRLTDFDPILMAAFVICFMASMSLTVRRKQPDVWSEVRQLWSVRAAYIGLIIIGAIPLWSCAVDLVTPVGQLSSNMPPVSVVLPVLAVGGLLAGGGIVLLIPEFIVRARRAKGRQV